MTHVMAKGANISLTAAAVRAVLHWQPGPGTPEVDASALLLGPSGRVRSDADFVFYNQPAHPSGLVRHQPAVGADAVEVVLTGLPPEVDRVLLTASSAGGAFPAVPGLRLVLHGLHEAGATQVSPPIAEFTVPDPGQVTALVTAELYRRDGGWKFRAVGQGYASGLSGLATDFGITVDDDTPPPAEPESYALAAPQQQSRHPGYGYGYPPPPARPPAVVLPPQGPQFRSQSPVL